MAAASYTTSPDATGESILRPRPGTIGAAPAPAAR